MNKVELKILRTSLKKVKEKEVRFLYYREKGQRAVRPQSITNGSFLWIADGVKVKKTQLRTSKIDAKKRGAKPITGSCFKKNGKVYFEVKTKTFAASLRKGLKKIKSAGCPELDDKKIKIKFGDPDDLERLSKSKADRDATQKREGKAARQAERLQRVQSEDLDVDELIDIARHSGEASEIAMGQLRDLTRDQLGPALENVGITDVSEMVQDAIDAYFETADIGDLANPESLAMDLAAMGFLLELYEDPDGPQTTDELCSYFEESPREEGQSLLTPGEEHVLRIQYEYEIKRRPDIVDLCAELRLDLDDALVLSIISRVVDDLDHEDLLSGSDFVAADVCAALTKHHAQVRSADVELTQNQELAIHRLQRAVGAQMHQVVDTQLDDELVEHFGGPEKTKKYADSLCAKLGTQHLEIVSDSNLDEVTQAVAKAVQMQANHELGLKGIKGTKLGGKQYTGQRMGADTCDIGTLVLTIGVKITDGTLIDVVAACQAAGGDLVHELIKVIPGIEQAIESGAITSQGLESFASNLVTSGTSGLADGVETASVILSEGGKIAVAGVGSGLAAATAVVEGVLTANAAEDFDAFSKAAKSSDPDIAEVGRYAKAKTRRKVATHAISTGLQGTAAAAGVATVASLATGPGAAFIVPITGAVALGAGLTDVGLTKIPKMFKAIWKLSMGTKGKNRKKNALKVLKVLKNDQNPLGQKEAMRLLFSLGILQKGAKARYYVDGSCDKILMTSLMYHMKSV